MSIATIANPGFHISSAKCNSLAIIQLNDAFLSLSMQSWQSFSSFQVKTDLNGSQFPSVSWLMWVLLHKDGLGKHLAIQATGSIVKFQGTLLPCMSHTSRQRAWTTLFEHISNAASFIPPFSFTWVLQGNDVGSSWPNWAGTSL